MTELLSGWGNYPRAETRLLTARGRDEARAAVSSEASLIARGNGRSYGDAALSRDAVLSMLRSSRMIAFDEASGTLTCEAGVMLADILDLFVPRGWFPPVTPGTKFVTIGGMIAADVHGKNHHGAGSFTGHVDSFELALADGQVVRCSRTENAELFAATCGGMGLTGIIVTASFRLLRIETPYIRQETRQAANLAEAMDLLGQSASATYSVAWIDCLSTGAQMGRSVIFSGEHALPHELPAPPPKTGSRTLTMPFHAPAMLLNRWTISAFNQLYYQRNPAGTAIIPYGPYFYPLDAILAWNRLYGRAGFVQYQCVLPKAAAAEGMAALLRRIAASGKGSFLAVLKQFGAANPHGMLSFPMEGFTLALDFAVDQRTLALLGELDAITGDHGGRVYLAKDACSRPELLRRGYPRLDEFLAVRHKVDPHHKFSSLLSQRLGL